VGRTIAVRGLPIAENSFARPAQAIEQDHLRPQRAGICAVASPFVWELCHFSRKGVIFSKD
jgi:hypothetical protein